VGESVITVSELTRHFVKDGSGLRGPFPCHAVPSTARRCKRSRQDDAHQTHSRLLRAESGSVRVFGLDPVADPVAVSRVSATSPRRTISRPDAGR